MGLFLQLQFAVKSLCSKQLELRQLHYRADAVWLEEEIKATKCCSPEHKTQGELLVYAQYFSIQNHCYY